MAFPWVALGLGLLQFGGSIFASSQQRTAQATGKKKAEKINKANFERAMLEYDLDWEQAGATFAWDMAKTEATRFVERQRKADYGVKTDQLLDQALNNLRLNSSALQDKYKLEEGLRATEAKLKLKELSGANSNETRNQIRSAKTKATDIQLNDKKLRNEQDISDMNYAVRRKNLAQQALLNEQQTTQQVYELLQGVKSKRRQRNILRQNLENKGVTLQEQNTLEMKQKLMERDVLSIQAAFEGAGARATGASRSGGTATGRRIAMNAAQEFGRTYGQIQMLKQQQMAKQAGFNAEVQGPRAKEMAQLSQDMMTMAERSGNLISQQKTKNQSLRQQQLAVLNEREEMLGSFGIAASMSQNQVKGLKRGLKSAREKVALSYNTARRQTNQLTLPSFDIAQRQGVREMSGLYLQTKASIESASTPFRDSVIFDPIAPTRGLEPEKLVPQSSPMQSPISQYGNAIMAGVDQALKFSEVTSSGLRFY